MNNLNNTNTYYLTYNNVILNVEFHLFCNTSIQLINTAPILKSILTNR